MMNNICLKFAVAMIAFLTLAANANAVTRTVDCDKGQTIQAALDKGQGSAERLLINVSGTCEEDVSISRDDVIIDGNATVKGTIRLSDARRIEINNIKVTGPGIGIELFGGHVELRNVNVIGNLSFGVAVNQNSFLVIYHSNISNNALDGVHVIVGSTVEIHNTDILNNIGNGIEIDRHSNADIRDGCEISGNENGVRMYLHSSAFITDTEITANRSNGILMDNDSGVIAFSPVNISGNTDSGVLCFDTESSFETNAVIIDTIDCTGFSQPPPSP